MGKIVTKQGILRCQMVVRAIKEKKRQGEKMENGLEGGGRARSDGCHFSFTDEEWEAGGLAQGHTARKWSRQELNPGLSELSPGAPNHAVTTRGNGVDSWLTS